MWEYSVYLHKETMQWSWPVQTSTNDKRPKTLDHANRKATEHSPGGIVVWGDE